MAKDISAIDAAIADCNTRISTLQQKRQAIVDAENAALASRSQGIPASWLPIFEVRAGVVTVTAWYDPTKWGKNCDKVIQSDA